jgi:hypothetical protein
MDNRELEGMSDDELDAYAERCNRTREALAANGERLVSASAAMDQCRAQIDDTETLWTLEQYLRCHRLFYETCVAIRLAFDERDELYQTAHELGLDVPPAKPNLFYRYQ